MKILRRVRKSIAAHARQSRPWECCGILLAEPSAPEVVTRAVYAENVANDARKRYVLDPKAHIRAARMEREGVVRIAGYYHSHPDGGSRPTPRDIEQAVASICYLIVGLDNGRAEFGAWRFGGGLFTTEPLEVAE